MQWSELGRGVLGMGAKYLPYEYQTTGSNEPLIAEFNVYFLHCTASAYLLILSLYRIMHDDTVKKQNFV